MEERTNFLDTVTSTITDDIIEEECKFVNEYIMSEIDNELIKDGVDLFAKQLVIYCIDNLTSTNKIKNKQKLLSQICENVSNTTNKLFSIGNVHTEWADICLRNKKISKEWIRKCANSCLKKDEYYKLKCYYINIENYSDEIKNKYMILQSIYLLALPQPVQRSLPWFEMRNTMISASDIATAIGSNPYQKKKDLILKKCNYGPKFKGNKYTQWGVKYEQVATIIWEHNKNDKIIEYGLIKHPFISFIGASPDGISLSGIMLEIKCPFTRKIKSTGVRDGVPLYYWVQVQIQLEVCNLLECDFEQCKLSEYETKKEFYEDSSEEKEYISKDGKFKGAIIQLIKNEFEDEFDMYEYIYMDKVANNNIKEWISENKKKIKSNCVIGVKDEDKEIIHELLGQYYESNNNEIKTILKEKGYTEQIINDNRKHYKKFDKVLYWKLDEYTCVTVKRDREWFALKLPIIKKTWEDILYYREHGVDSLIEKEISVCSDCIF